MLGRPFVRERLKAFRRVPANVIPGIVPEAGEEGDIHVLPTGYDVSGDEHRFRDPVPTRQ